MALVPAALLTACAGSASTARPEGVVAADAVPTPAARVLPITPVAAEYTLADPAFQALAGARALWGTYEGGAYQIEVPDAWNGDVVYFAHGYRLNVPELTVTPPPIRDHLIARGYGWAASSFTANGYEPGIAARDTLALREVVERELGTPRRSYIYGQSMGGHVVSLVLEQHPDAFDGALAECGAIAGNQVLDYFLSWGVLAGYFSGVDMSRYATDPAAFSDAIATSVLPALGPADALTPEGQAFADVIERFTGGPRPFFDEGFATSYGINFGILSNAVASAGPANAAAQNIDTAYDIGEGFGVSAAELNRQVPRISANPAVRSDLTRYPEFADVRGAISVPMMTLHTTGDLFVPISAEQEYRSRADAAGAGELLVQRAVRRYGHCAFSQQELTRAFDDLVAWVEGGPQPDGDDLTGSLEAAGLRFTDPLEPGDPAVARSGAAAP
jgi:dienelactone hydrolase